MRADLARLKPALADRTMLVLYRLVHWYGTGLFLRHDGKLTIQTTVPRRT